MEPKKGDRYYYNTRPDGAVEKIHVLSGKVVEVYRTNQQALQIANGEDSLIEVKVGDEVFKTDPILRDQGLPSNKRYNEIVAGIILAEVMNGKTLNKVLAKPGMPSMTIIAHWLQESDEFKKAMDHALRVNSYRYFDKVEDIATDLSNGDMSRTDVEAKKAAMDGFKWLAEKSDPERLGTKKESSNSSGVSVIINTGVPPKEDIEEVEYENIGKDTE